MADEYLLVITTCPSPDVAAGIATALIEERLAACVSRLDGVRSWFRWQGRLEQEEEHMLLIKTTALRFSELAAAIRRLHPSEVPEIIALPIMTGSSDYLTWLSENTSP